MTQFVDIQGEALAVHVFEPGQHRADAVLIHGATGSKEDFAEVGRLLSVRGYRVITFDSRGQHESSHSHRADAYSIESQALDAIALADLFGLSMPHLLGHSFGGLVAQRAVALLPDRWASLTLLCSGPHGVPDWPAHADTIRSLSMHSMEQAWEDRDVAARDGPRYELLKRRWLMSDPRSVTTVAKHLLTEPSIVGQVREAGVPAHVVYGEFDDAWPLRLQDEMARDLLARVTVIPGVGHSPNQDCPDLLATVLADFWDTN